MENFGLPVFCFLTQAFKSRFQLGMTKAAWQAKQLKASTPLMRTFLRTLSIY